MSNGLIPRPELNGIWTHDANLLLRAALADQTAATSSWRELCDHEDLGSFPYWKTRILPQVANNLVGISEELPHELTLRGVRRATWVSNSLRLRKLDALMSKVPHSHRFVLLKGGALCLHVDDLSSRAMSDIDVFIPNSVVADVLTKLADLGFEVRILGDFSQVLRRHRYRTTGCNVFHPDFGEIDVHWGIATNFPLAKLSLRNQEQIVLSSAVSDVNSNFRYCGREVLIVHTLQHMTRQDAKSIGATVQGLCDLSRLSRGVSDHLLFELLEKFELIDAYTQAVEYLTANNCHSLPEELPEKGNCSVNDSAFSPEIGTWTQNVTALQRLDPTPERPILRFYWLYSLWQLLGCRSHFESFLIENFGPFTKVFGELCSAASFDFEHGCECGNHCGVGWSPWIPTSQGVWSDRSDNRLLLRAPNNTRASGTLELELTLGQEWMHSPYSCTRIFANGHLIGTFQRSDRETTSIATRKYRLPATIRRGDIVEFSFRPVGFAPRRVLGVGSETHRLGIALRRIEIMTS